MLYGQVIKYGDNVDTDAIIPGRFLTDWDRDPQRLGAFCFADFDPSFKERVRPGTILCVGHNFGCGSSRQAAPVALKAAGVVCIIGKSFARIFLRNAINIGLPVVESEEFVEISDNGDLVSVNLDSGHLTNHCKDRTYCFTPLPPKLLEILNSGGLVLYVRKRLGMIGGDAGAEHN